MSSPKLLYPSLAGVLTATLLHAAPQTQADAVRQDPAAQAAAATAEKPDARATRNGKVLAPIDVTRLQTVTGVQLSPDGSTVAVLRRTPRAKDEPAGGSRTHLYIVPFGGGTPVPVVTGTESARGVAFRPGTRTLTLLRRADGGHPEVWGIPIDDDGKPGEATQITTTPRGVGAYQWRPDGKALAFTLLDAPPEGRAAARAKGFTQRIVDEDFDHISLWVWDAASGETARITEGMSVYDFEWSPTGDRIALGAAPRNLTDDSYMFKRLHVADLSGDAPVVTKLFDNPGKLGPLAWSPDGSRLAYISAGDKRDPHDGMLHSVGADGEDWKDHTPEFRGMVHDIAWHDTGILATISEGVHTALARIDPETDERTVLARQDAVETRAFDFTDTGEQGLRFAVVGSTPSHPAEAWSVQGDQLERLTNSNPWLGEIALGRQEVVRYAARDGLTIEGLLIHPVGAKKGVKHPLVIVAHGGPEAHFSHGWLTAYSQPGQVLAGRGYAVWYPNYRASTGYGVEFTKLDHGDPMGGEFNDHLDAIAHFAERGLIDRTRVGIIGGSYGGYTAAWAATAGSEHFAAAVSFVPFVDIRTKWLTSDIPWEFYLVHYEEKWPHEQVDFLAERSPLTHAAKCETPLLLLGGDADPRVHPSQPHMLYRAVQTATDTPVRYVQYPGEGHGNRINTLRYDYLLRSVRWLEHYLREGDHRKTPPPAFDLDYSDWK